MTDCHICGRSTTDKPVCQCSYEIGYLLAIVKAIADGAPSLHTAQELFRVAIAHVGDL